MATWNLEWYYFGDVLTLLSAQPPAGCLDGSGARNGAAVDLARVRFGTDVTNPNPDPNGFPGDPRLIRVVRAVANAFRKKENGVDLYRWGKQWNLRLVSHDVPDGEAELFLTPDVLALHVSTIPAGVSIPAGPSYTPGQPIPAVAASSLLQAYDDIVRYDKYASVVSCSDFVVGSKLQQAVWVRDYVRNRLGRPYFDYPNFVDVEVRPDLATAETFYEADGSQITFVMGTGEGVCEGAPQLGARAETYPCGAFGL